MSEVRNWLESIGLAQYAEAFEAHDIEMYLLNRIDDHALKDIGVSSTGHRLRIRDAIVKLVPTSIVEVSSAVVAAELIPTSAERRQLTIIFIVLVHIVRMPECLIRAALEA